MLYMFSAEAPLVEGIKARRLTQSDVNETKLNDLKGKLSF